MSTWKPYPGRPARGESDCVVASHGPMPVEIGVSTDMADDTHIRVTIDEDRPDGAHACVVLDQGGVDRLVHQLRHVYASMGG